MKTIKGIQLKDKELVLKLNSEGFYVLVQIEKNIVKQTVSSKNLDIMLDLFDDYRKKEMSV